MHVYVVDTGIRATHAELAGRAFLDFSAYGPPATAADCDGHGTHVAGIIAGSTVGVAPLALVHAVRVLDCEGSGTVSDVIAGIDWVTAHHQRPAVANVSLGGGRSEALNLAVARSVAAGVTYAVAAGNDAGDACEGSPASEPTAMTVGASGSDDAVRSSRTRACAWILFAPGRGIESAWVTSDTAMRVLSGTSMAAPHAAGVAALYLHTHATGRRARRGGGGADRRGDGLGALRTRCGLPGIVSCSRASCPRART